MKGIPQCDSNLLAIRPGDAVHAFAQAIHNLIQDVCPHAANHKDLLPSCVNPVLLKEYLQKVNVSSASGPIKFDEFHDNKRSYVVVQVQNQLQSHMKNPVPVASYDIITDEIDIDKEKLVWPEDIKDSDYNMKGHPESVCSHPCDMGEIYIQGEVLCCWTCRRCRNNEVVTEDGTSCRVCDLLTWPDPESNFTSCQPISPTYLTWDHLYAVGLATLAVCGLISTLIIVLLIVKHRERVVVKSSSRELIAVILSGIFLAFITIPCFINKPTDLWCNLNRLGFSLSGTFIFSPLFLKCVKIYRVFAASEQFRTGVQGASMQMQIFFAGILIAVQVSPPQILLIKIINQNY